MRLVDVEIDLITIEGLRRLLFDTFSFYFLLVEIDLITIEGLRQNKEAIPAD